MRKLNLSHMSNFQPIFINVINNLAQFSEMTWCEKSGSSLNFFSKDIKLKLFIHYRNLKFIHFCWLFESALEVKASPYSTTFIVRDNIVTKFPMNKSDKWIFSCLHRFRNCRFVLTSYFKKKVKPWFLFSVNFICVFSYQFHAIVDWIKK